MNNTSKRIKRSIFNFYYNLIEHLPEDQQYALGDTLHDEFTDAELQATQGQEFEYEIHSEIMKKLKEIEKTL